MAKQLKPNRGMAILKPVEETEKTFGAIIIPDIGETKASQAVIVRMEPTYNYNLGKEVPSLFKVGDTVLYPALGSQKLTLDRQEYIICAVSELLSAIEEIDE